MGGALRAAIPSSGDRVVHLLNYDNGQPLQAVRVRLAEHLSAPVVAVFSPDTDPEARELAVEAGVVDVGPLRTYAAVVIPGEGEASIEFAS